MRVSMESPESSIWRAMLKPTSLGALFGWAAHRPSTLHWRPTVIRASASRRAVGPVELFDGCCARL